MINTFFGKYENFVFYSSVAHVMSPQDFLIGNYESQHADWVICRKRGQYAEGSDEALDEPIICWTT